MGHIVLKINIFFILTFFFFVCGVEIFNLSIHFTEFSDERIYHPIFIFS